MMAIAGLVATSCQDNLAPVANEGDIASVSLQVETPEIATRTYSDGMSATVLQYAVYDEAGNEISDLTVTDAVINGKTTVELKLTTGNTYSMIFWAAAPNAPYDVHLTDKTMSVDYTTAVSNDENRDAFYKYVEPFTVTGTMSKTVELKRPFAQLNIGTSDYAASEKAGYVPTESYVKVPAYSALNLVTGEVSEQVTVEYDYAAIDRTETFPVTGYEYIAMNYLLVSADKGVVDVEFAYTDGATEKTRTVGSVPVQRNHRTNLYGQLLTSDVEINVEILPDYDEEDLPETDAEKLAIVAQLGGSVTLTGDLTLTEPIVVNAPMVLDLGGYTITTELKSEGRHHYAIDNYSVLTLQGEGEINARGIENFGIMTINGDITITNVDTNGGSAIWNEGNLTINGGTFTTNTEAGVGSYGGALYTEEGATCVVNGGTFVANSQLTYAVLNYGKTTFNNGIVKGKHGAIAGGIDENGEYYGKTTINGGSFELMENPAVSDHCAYYINDIRGGKFTLGTNTDSGAKLFYNSVIAEGYKAVENAGWTYVVEAEVDAIVASQDEFAAAVTGNEASIVLAPGTYTMPTAKGKTLTIVGSGSAEETVITIAKTGGEGASLVLDGSNVVFENITISTDSKNYTGYGRCNATYNNCIVNGTYTLYGTSVFENCTFNVTGNVYNVWTWGALTANFNNCTFNSDGKAMLLYGMVNTKLTIENSVFNDNGGLTDLKAAIEIGNDYGTSYELIVNNTVVNGYEINDTGINTGTTLWANKNSMGQDKLNVVVDGVDVY